MTWLHDRRLLLPAYCVYLLTVLYLVLSPEAGAAGAGVSGVLSILHSAGLDWVTGGHVEFALNVALFLPFGFLGTLLWRLPWHSWWGLGFAASASLEGFQWAFLPHRSPTVSDLVANSSGALLGAVLAVLCVREVRASERGETARPALLSPWQLVWLAATMIAGVAVLVLSPSSELPTRAVLAVSRMGSEAGGPAWLASTSLWERLLNVLLFVPLGILAALARPGWSLLRWAVVGLAASAAVEVVQWQLLPSRDASAYDILTNTIGMVLGAAVVLALMRLFGRRPTERPDRP